MKSGTDAKGFVEKSSTARETEFILPALKGQVIVATHLVGPDERAEVTFEAPVKVGDYTFVCTFPGRFNLGMKRQLIAK